MYLRKERVNSQICNRAKEIRAAVPYEYRGADTRLLQGQAIALAQSEAAREARKAALTLDALADECRSPLEFLPAMLPELQMDFVDDLPYCRTFEKCVATASPILATSTVLVVPRASPFGNAYDRAAEPCPLSAALPCFHAS